jgi:elongation factor P hydroxylase
MPMGDSVQPCLDKLSSLVELFHDVFNVPEDEGEGGGGEAVRLRGGFAEPFYRAPGAEAPAEIRFTRDYVNSCLHEVAHWCIAGKTRRLSDDYGYWYRPDGRDGDQQREFFKAEAGPQALEWAFAAACGEEFRMSCDNLAGEVRGEEEFAVELRGKLGGYLENGFPKRGSMFLAALMARYHPEVERRDIAAWLAARTLGSR